MKKQPLIDVIIAETLKQESGNEVKITQEVAEIMIRKRAGLFQNEVDYRILAPSFKPLENDCHARSGYRADLIGYTQSGFVVAEFKIYDESKRNKNPWGVLHFLQRDIAKLEALAKTKNRLWGDLIAIVALRNADIDSADEQVVSMLRASKSKVKPRLKSSRYYPVLLVLADILKRNPKWDVVIKKKRGTAFLIASRKF